MKNYLRTPRSPSPAAIWTLGPDCSLPDTNTCLRQIFQYYGLDSIHELRWEGLDFAALCSRCSIIWNRVCVTQGSIGTTAIIWRLSSHNSLLSNGICTVTASPHTTTAGLRFRPDGPHQPANIPRHPRGKPLSQHGRLSTKAHRITCKSTTCS